MYLYDIEKLYSVLSTSDTDLFRKYVSKWTDIQVKMVNPRSPKPEDQPVWSLKHPRRIPKLGMQTWYNGFHNKEFNPVFSNVR